MFHVDMCFTSFVHNNLSCLDKRLPCFRTGGSAKVNEAKNVTPDHAMCSLFLGEGF